MAPGLRDRAAPGRVAIVAGNGRIPVFVAERLAAAGRNPFILAIEGEADSELLRYEHETVYTTQVGVLLSALRRVNPQEVVMVGGVKARPDLWRLRPDWTTLRLAARILPKLRHGDDALLRSVISMIEEAGFPVRGVHELVPELLADRGQIAGPRPSRRDRETIAVAVKGAMALGALDAGQACVAVGKRIVALEGAEGTDMMLQRVAELRALGRIKGKRGGVLVKLAKPGQDLRADLPTIGSATVENAQKAGLNGIAVQAERALISDFATTCDQAKRASLFIVGIDPEMPEKAGED
ncbi:LpxI family protein [Oricola nitratireducens]|uniref:LpxI family protein n=1 Tax=Oricola nitratireducens TaxID=2775868 RepID=UPI0018660CE4|nr:UDP-2,3-diacylglucosamine diphosphatase LpxI [Oricola nitratireducens]